MTKTRLGRPISPPRTFGILLPSPPSTSPSLTRKQCADAFDRASFGWTEDLRAIFELERRRLAEKALLGEMKESPVGAWCCDVLFSIGVTRDMAGLRLLVANGVEDIIGWRIPGLHVVALTEFAKGVSFLLGSGADINARDKWNRTAVHLLLHHRPLDEREVVAILKLTLAAGADVRGLDGEPTPLHLAAAFGTPRIAQILIAHGARVEAKDSNGMTALFWASRNRDIDAMVGVLAAAGANFTHLDHSGRGLSAHGIINPSLKRMLSRVV